MAAAASAADAALERAAAAMGANGLQVAPLFGRRHRLYVRPGVQARARVAEDHRPLVRAHDQLRNRLDARRDPLLARGSAGRRRLSACGAAAQRAVRERRVRVERGRQRAGRRAALRRRPRPPAVDHAAGRHQGGDQEQRDGPPGNARRQDLCRSRRSPSPAASGRSCSSAPTASSTASNRAFPIRCSATRRSSPPIPTTATSAA